LALEGCECQEDDVPTYQYACTACGHQLEAVQSFADEPLTECPACEGRLRKLFSSVGVVFKGSGFYRTDSRTGSPSDSSSDSSSSETPTGAKSEKSETKSGTAKETSATPAPKKEAAATPAA
jgi:putative FmdB family regulatory protein